MADPVAALFVDPKGFYAGRADVELWDEERDARRYAGPWPVVAHPPCQLWTNMAHLNYKRYGKEKNRPGNDGGCFASALASARKFGGVLEHPAGSHAWRKFSLPRPPKAGGWIQHGAADEWVCRVAQSAYGHRARKDTWLLFVGPRPAELDWERKPGTHQCGWFDRIKPTLGKRDASATPPGFGELLLAMARSVRR